MSSHGVVIHLRAAHGGHLQGFECACSRDDPIGGGDRKDDVLHHTLSQGAFSAHSGNIQCTFKEHSGKIQGTFIGMAVWRTCRLHALISLGNVHERFAGMELITRSQRSIT